MSAELLNLGKYKPEACTHLNSLMHGTCSLFPSFTPVIIVPIPRFSSKVLDKTLKFLQTRVGNGLRNAVALVSIPTQGWVALGSVRNVAGKSPREHWEFIEHDHIRCADKSSWKKDYISWKAVWHPQTMQSRLGYPNINRCNRTNRTPWNDSLT